MAKKIAWGTMLLLLLVLTATSLTAPYYLSDEGNGFFRAFVTHELLSVLGVIVTITLASAANLHLELNKLEETTTEGFSEARRAVRLSAYSLIALFVIALVAVVCKPLAGDSQTGTALFNSLSFLILLFSIGVMADLTAAVFSIPAMKTK